VPETPAEVGAQPASPPLLHVSPRPAHLRGGPSNGISINWSSPRALRPPPERARLLVVADGAVHDCHGFAAKYGARVLDI